MSRKTLIPAASITTHKVLELLEDSKIRVQLDDDDDILADIAGVRIVLDVKEPLLRMHAVWRVREGIRREELAELVARVNDEMPLVRCSIPKNQVEKGEGHRLWLDYQIITSGDLTQEKIVASVRAFVKWSTTALERCDKDGILD